MNKPIRCAIYCRKSSDENLDCDFNSLDAQQESGQNYIAAQRSEGWELVDIKYHDGGFSGGNMERPALKRLLKDVCDGKIDIIVVYKIDRLSRSLLDFAELIGTFDKHNVTFVAVTQQFSTTTSMGRLTLNILLSFAQFEREIIGERIRDKIAMQKQRGLQTGGAPILGYNLVDSKLVVNPEEAATVRRIFKRFAELGSATLVMKEMREQGVQAKNWTTVKGKRRTARPINKAHIYRMLNNRKYLGEVTHKGKIYKGQHAAIIDQKIWDQAQTILASNWRKRANETRSSTPAMLKGIIRCGHCGCSMRPGWSSKKGKKYRYYICLQLDKQNKEVCPVRRISAAKAEDAVLNQLRAILSGPEILAHAARSEDIAAAGLSEQDVAKALKNVDGVWDYLFPVEQARIAQTLLESVSIAPNGIDVKVKSEGLSSLLLEITAANNEGIAS